MANQHRAQFAELETGHAFPPAGYLLEPQLIASYLKATGETNPLFTKDELVPPTAVATYALAALAESMEIPPGTIHTSQEIVAAAPVYVNDAITCQATVSSKRSRKSMEMMTIDIEVTNQDGTTVLRGKTSFMTSPQFSI